MTGEAVARVKNVSHRYGATVSLADVSIDIPSRIMVGVIGPDGVGKSTLLGLIAGVKVIQSGEVVVFDNRVRPGRRHELVLGNDLSGAGHERDEDVQGAAAEPNRTSILEQHALARNNHERSERQTWGVHGHLLNNASMKRATLDALTVSQRVCS